MHDLIIRGASLVDGTGAPAYRADVAITAGQIAEISTRTISALTGRRVIDADGAYLTPGFVDIHTHYDGEATWDPLLEPSVLHGTTSAVMGNCGVGFAPVRPGETDRLVRLMEGVEEIPGAVLSAGLSWNWSSFESYMDLLASHRRTINLACLVPHDCLRYYVMGERAARLESATEQDLLEMRSLLASALHAGAWGFSTGRSDNHRTSRGEFTPAARAARDELCALGGVLRDFSYRVLHAVNDFDCAEGAPEEQRGRFEVEYELMQAFAQSAARPLALTWLERLNAPQQWRWLQEAADASRAQGVEIRLQAAPRAIGVLNSMDTTFCVLTPFASYQAIAHLPLGERAQALRQPGLRARILNEAPQRLADGHNAIPPIVDHILANLDQVAMLMFAMTANERGHVNYEPDPRSSFGAQARQRGVRALEVIYDYLAQGDGSSLVYFPIFNFLQGSLSSVKSMLEYPHTLLALGDAGAHVGTICDASNSTTLLAHWARDKSAMSFEAAVHMLTQRNAQHMGMPRGTIALGAAADLNLIELGKLGARMPQVRRDLPGGGKRIVQAADGYLATLVSGEVVCENGALTDARPGGLLRAQ